MAKLYDFDLQGETRAVFIRSRYLALGCSYKKIEGNCKM